MADVAAASRQGNDGSSGGRSVGRERRGEARGCVGRERRGAGREWEISLENASVAGSECARRHRRARGSARSCLVVSLVWPSEELRVCSRGL